MKLFAALCLLLVPLAYASTQTPQLSQETREFVSVDGATIALTHVRVIDGTGAAPLQDQTVIVNGGLGPTIDDLSQEIAARAAGVELELNAEWLARMELYFQRRSRAMPVNNTKQAMLPAGAEGSTVHVRASQLTPPPTVSRLHSPGRR